MNTTKHIPSFFFAFLFLLPSTFSQQKPLTASGFATKASIHTDFESNEAYQIENAGMDGRSFARNRSTATKLRLKEDIRRAENLLDNSNGLVVMANEKIAMAKRNLSYTKSQGRLSAKAIMKMESDILSVEEKLKQLQKSSIELQQLLSFGATI